MKVFSQPSPQQSFQEAVIFGLSQAQKSLSPKYFYDSRGSELFEKIVSQPEYYIPTAEMEILDQKSKEITPLIEKDPILMEFGSGASKKVRVLLEGITNLKKYIAVDIAEDFLAQSCQILENDYPHLQIYGIATDYTQDFFIPKEIKSPDENMSIFFPGSTIGNLDKNQRLQLLQRMQKLMGSSGHILLGVDLWKDQNTLEKAYNDAAQMTAEFNLNILHRMNRELEAQIPVEKFAHKAIVNEKEKAVEMHLLSLEDQTISIGNNEFHLKKGESIHTENSHKFTPEAVNTLAQEAELSVEKFWTDSKGSFAVYLFRSKN